MFLRVQGRAACKKLQERLVADLQQFPEKTFLQAILDRTNGNLGESLPCVTTPTRQLCSGSVACQHTPVVADALSAHVHAVDSA